MFALRQYSGTSQAVANSGHSISLQSDPAAYIETRHEIFTRRCQEPLRMAFIAQTVSKARCEEDILHMWETAETVQTRTRHAWMEFARLM